MALHDGLIKEKMVLWVTSALMVLERYKKQQIKKQKMKSMCNFA
jgi:hypothetical protein